MKRNRITTIAFASTLAPIIATAPLMSSCSKEKDNEYHLLSINDIHGAIAGYGEDVVKVSEKNPGCLRLAREINKITKAHPGSVFVSAGDENSGDAWSVCSNGRTTYPVLSSMGIRYAAVGNHAFEWGLDDMATGRYDRLGRTDKTEGKYFVASNILSSNLYQDKEWCIDEQNANFLEDFTLWQNQRVNWADPYKILNFGNATVCLIGLTTANTLIDGNKKITNQLSFIDYNTSIHYTKYLAKRELGDERYNQIDSFILLTHIDSDYTNKVLSGEAVQLASEVDTDIDAIISAHSHKTGCGKIWNNRLNKAILIGQAGTAGQNFLDTKIIVDPKAKAGDRITSMSMEVNKVPIPTDKEEAQTEWGALTLTQDPDLKPVADEYLVQKEIVHDLVSEKIGEVTLDPNVEGEEQLVDGKGFLGYYNSSLHSGKQIGHHYITPDKTLDHFGGWISRATMIGFAIQYWDEIKKGELPMPSVCMNTQDSSPAEISAKEIKLKDTFEMQPHDNTLHLGYVSIMQLANIFNYSLAGIPNGEDVGFNYEKRNKYKPDLTYFVPVQEVDATHEKPEVMNDYAVRVAYNLLDEKKVPLIQSAYVCGMMMWYGVRPHLVKITDEERKLTFKNPQTGNTSPVFDPSAEYRVRTYKTKVSYEGKDVELYLPEMLVYDGSKLNFGDIDDPDSSSWHKAEWWFEAEHPSKSSSESTKLIPIQFSSFNYTGGNEQTRLFEQYCQYSFFNYGYQFYGYDTSENIRDLVTTFCRYSVPSTEEWTQFIIPTNIKWKIIESLGNWKD